MSKQKIFSLVIVFSLLLIAVFAGFYFYKKNQSNSAKIISPTAEEIKLNQASNFKPSIPDTRTPEEITKDLNSVQMPNGSSTVSNTSVLNSLNSINP